MVKLILEVNVKAGFENEVLGKLVEVFNKPFVSQIEQLSDFYLVLDLTDENVEKVVKPPQNPTAPSRYISPLDNAIIIPINNEPRALAVNVPISDAIAK